MNKIEFVPSRTWLNKKSASAPGPASKEIPEWYLKADRYAKDEDGNDFIGMDGGKIPSWKACPAIYDILATGYVLKTPCDIEFIEEDGELHVDISDPKCQDFIHYRDKMPGFESPMGYRDKHFAWWPDWMPSVPEGYSVLFSQPFNRFDLPFLNTSGVVDSDCVDIPGTIPFFIAKDWSGIIPKGTPYVQLFPFKREDWEHSHKVIDPFSMENRIIENSIKYRVPNGGVYLNEVWHRRKYV
jgi:hypothetical protein